MKYTNYPDSTAIAIAMQPRIALAALMCVCVPNRIAIYFIFYYVYLSALSLVTSDFLI